MKSKALTGILLVVVGLIWYNAFFRVKDSLFGEEETFAQRSLGSPISFASLSRDTFSINLEYRDPFGETKRSYRGPVENDQTVQTRPVARRIKPVINWPAIVYFGQVRKTSSKDPLAIIGIDGHKHTMRTGEKVYDGITIKAIGRDSLVIYYQKEKRVFWRGG
ncbi:MAG: hypothetical protein HRT58_22050 [Crocinitomicaceae bacterium]|nr:hypothetical protein [Flavobacteriales bacterium]NQZ38359.1 hypothetical protein [Crocinitomicaceae bacterium]